MRLIENLASRNSTKNTSYKEQMAEVKAKLVSVHKLLRNRFSSQQIWRL